jgi:hypothetical protein
MEDPNKQSHTAFPYGIVEQLHDDSLLPKDADRGDSQL